MLGLRNLYRVFQESRSASRRRATLAVTGNHLPEAATLADLLGAQRNADGAEAILMVTRAPVGVEAHLSGEAVEDAETVSLSAVSGKAVSGELAPRIAGALEEDYLVPIGRGYPVLRRAVCEEIIRHNAHQNAVIGALPIPGADMPAIIVNQIRMVLGIAATHDEELSVERARELIGMLAAGFGFRALPPDLEARAGGGLGSCRRRRLRGDSRDGPRRDPLLRARQEGAGAGGALRDPAPGA